MLAPKLKPFIAQCSQQTLQKIYGDFGAVLEIGSTSLLIIIRINNLCVIPTIFRCCASA